MLYPPDSRDKEVKPDSAGYKNYEEVIYFHQNCLYIQAVAEPDQ
jgi:hypothetical protein